MTLSPSNRRRPIATTRWLQRGKGTCEIVLQKNLNLYICRGNILLMDNKYSKLLVEEFTSNATPYWTNPGDLIIDQSLLVWYEWNADALIT